MFANLYAKLAGAGLILALILGAYAWAHHAGAVSQKASDDVKLTNAATALSNAQAQLGADAKALDQIRDYASTAQAAAAAQQAKGQQAVKVAQDDAATQAKAATAWQAKFRKASQSKGCATLMQQAICAQVFK
jgi:hypothetical protein